MAAVLNNLKNPIFKIYPYTLTYELFYDEEKAQSIYLPGVEEALNMLPEEYKELILMRFKDGMTYDEIGGKIERSRERVRTKIAKATRMLRHPSRLRKIMVVSREDHITETSKLKDQIYKAESINKRLTNKLESAGLLSQEDILDCVELNNLEDISIEELELTVRSYNCLKRAGINTLFDITFLRKEDLVKIRNCGRNSAEEIIKKCEKFGLKFINQFDENDIRNLDISISMKIDLIKSKIYTIDQLTELTVDDMVALEFAIMIDNVDHALSKIGKSFKPNDEVENTCLSDDLKNILIGKGYTSINKILEVYDKDWIEIIGEDNEYELNQYMRMRETPLKHKPDPRHVKTTRNPDGENVADLGITQFTVDLLSSAGINTIKELTSMTFDQTYEILTKEMTGRVYRADLRQLMNELGYRLKERDLNFQFTKDMVRNIKIMNANISFYTKSLLNSVMIYTIGDLLEYEKIDQLKKREGELHEIDKLIHDAKELLDKANG